MLVYGDPKFSSSTEALVGALKRSLRNSGENRVDFWRKFLIRAGQLEQGLVDFGDRAKALTATAEHLTNLGAAAFFRAWCSESPGEHLTIIHQIEALLDAFNGAEDFRLTIKVPEGYEFYALFPEQYIVSAQRWSVERDGDKSKRVLVVGVRSIGTSLSALVAESLRNQGWEARRITVRPGGDPFRRELVLEPQPAESLAIIVDEGPGLSGSSMAAVGEALEAGGFLKTKVAAFPSHGNEPGSAASSKVREWWRKVPRYFTNLDQLRWGGLSLQDILLDQSRLHLGTGDMKLQDITGGDWRQFVFGSEEDWCAFHGPFERVKYRCQAADGRAVLWKFAGLGAWTNDSLADEEAFSFFPEEDSQLRKASVTLRTLDEWGGFACVPWIQGRALKGQDLSASLLGTIARHLMVSAKSPSLAGEESFERLCEMLKCNVREAFGAGFADRAQGIIAQFNWSALSKWPAYSDGRMSPHEWLRDAEGRIYKTDSTGNMVDHTVVGPQPLLWDIAGAIVEWNLTVEQIKEFLGYFAERDLPVQETALQFYLAAYTVFKVGQAALSAVMSQGEARLKLEEAQAFYRGKAELILTGH